MSGGGRSPIAKVGGRLEACEGHRGDIQAMSTPLNDPGLAALLARIDELQATIASQEVAVREKLPELRRQARARPHRRGGNGSADARKYAIGGAVMMLVGDIDPAMLVGLLAQTDVMLKWLARERLAHGPRSFNQLLGAIFADPRKAQWCERWGRLIIWSNRKALYDANVARFEQSGKAGPDAAWRRKTVTNDQDALVELLCGLLNLAKPVLDCRGAAYEWIKRHGGDPANWAPPAHPNQWSDDDDDLA